MTDYLLDHSDQGLRLAKVMQGRVVAFDFELQGLPPHHHHGVYRGTIKDIHKGGQMAFVDIGLKDPGALPLKERKLPPVTRGETVCVQVTREADLREGKGVQLSRNISLALGPILYTPFTPGFNVSKKLKSPELEAEFKQSIQEGEGVILRHWANLFDIETLETILEHLRHKWREIESHKDSAPPCCLLAPQSLLERLISQIEPGDQIQCNHRPTVEKLTQLLLDSYGGGPEIELTRESPFDDNIEDQWDGLTETEISVPGGGQLIIEETAALVSIDINSGGSPLTGHDLNRRALKEVFHQIQLRNLAGIIMIDLAGNIKHPKQIIQSAQSLAGSDTHVHGITDLGLLEVSRRKSGPSLAALLRK